MNESLLHRRRRDLAWWRSQAEAVERHRSGMKWVGVAGLPLSGVGALVHPLLGGAAIATTALIGLMGLYMTSVRAQEMRGHILSCQEEIDLLVAQAEPAPSTAHHGVAP